MNSISFGSECAVSLSTSTNDESVFTPGGGGSVDSVFLDWIEGGEDAKAVFADGEAFGDGGGGGGSCNNACIGDGDGADSFRTFSILSRYTSRSSSSEPNPSLSFCQFNQPIIIANSKSV